MARRRSSNGRKPLRRSVFLIETVDVVELVARDHLGQRAAALRLELTGTWTHGTRQRITAAIPASTARGLAMILPKSADKADALKAAADADAIKAREHLRPVEDAVG